MDLTFFTFICCKICNVCLKWPKINEKEAGLAHFLKKRSGLLTPPFLIMSPFASNCENRANLFFAVSFTSFLTSHVNLFSMRLFFKNMCHSRPLFLHFRLYNIVNSQYKSLQITVFELQASGVGSNTLPTEPQPLPLRYLFLHPKWPTLAPNTIVVKRKLIVTSKFADKMRI